MFRTVPLSIIRSFSLYTQQWYTSYRFADSLRAGSERNCGSVLILLASCMTYTIAVCTVKNYWWWTEELSETWKFLFQKEIWEIGASSWFYYKNIYGFSVWILFHVTFLAPRILSRFPDFLENLRSPGLSNCQQLLNINAYKKTKIPPPVKVTAIDKDFTFHHTTSSVVLLWYVASLGANLVNPLWTTDNLHHT
jgi:hypothetical protein